jgi:hypothetical protein
MELTVSLARLAPVLTDDSILTRDGCDESEVEAVAGIEPEPGLCPGS